MITKKIKYADFNGVEREEEFQFNMSESDIVEWLTTNGDYTIETVIDHMAKKSDVKAIMLMFKDLIYRAYGEKSIDGKKFVKTAEVKSNFMDSPAYSVLFMELISDPVKAAEFIKSLVPAKFSDELENAMKKAESQGITVKLPEEE